jgi:uncharacterized damage-inducible protein DinB
MRKDGLMSAIQMLLAELDHEARATRRVLERVPGDRLHYRPHEKSMTLGQLALHVAVVPGGIAQLSRKSPAQVPEFRLPSPDTAAELVPALERSLAQAHEILAGLDDAALGETWRLVDGDREILAQPVGVMLRALMLNHWYHHRGQLCVYLRQVGVPVPAVYGPSADENPFVELSLSGAA